MKVCVATGTRAEYGLLKPLIDELKEDSNFDVQLLITGTHLSPEFGRTVNQIDTEGIRDTYSVEMILSSDTPEGISKSMGLGQIGFSEAFKNLKPDLLIILGDRFEMLSLASTALIFRVPIVHIHGGEVTEGAYDDSIRHAITKLSHIHFTSTEEYRKRVIQLGENPSYVFNVGAIGIDNIQKIRLLSSVELEDILKIKFKQWNYLISFHPETLSEISTELQIKELINALDKLDDSFIIFTKSNADTGGRYINSIAEKYVNVNPGKSAFFDSLGSLKYLSMIKECTAIVGNSSSGIIEAPSLYTPTINIGERQTGRTQAKSILNTDFNTNNIFELLLAVQKKNTVNRMFESPNPYGIGGVSQKIASVLKTIDVTSLGVKRFCNR